MELVTVTCNRDRWLLELQALSLKHINSCNINIVINEDDTSDWLDWFETIKPLYNKFNLRILSKKDFTSVNNGWISQQLIKLYFSQHTSDDYIVLDSKNFFAEKIDLSSYLNPRRIETKNFYSLQQELEIKNVVPASTPYRLNPNIVKDLINSYNNFENWFLSLSEQSEFVVYDWFVQKNNIEIPLADSMCKTIWYHETYDFKKWDNIKKPILGIHPWFIKMNANIDWKKWLENKNLSLPTTPVPSLAPLDWSKLCG